MYQRGSLKLFSRGDPTLGGVWGFKGNLRDESGRGFHASANSRITYGVLSRRLGVGVISLGDSGGTYPSLAVSPVSGDTPLGNIGTGDFTIMATIRPVQPATGHYPVVFGSLQPDCPYVFYDPLNVLGLGDGIVFRISDSLPQAVTSPPASAFYNRCLLLTFLRRGGNCEAYYNGTRRLSYTDNTSITASLDTILFSRDSDMWVLPTAGSGTGWASIPDAYDNNPASGAAYPAPPVNPLTLTLGGLIQCNKVRVWYFRDGNAMLKVELDDDGVWTSIYEATNPGGGYPGSWIEISGFGTITTDKVRISCGWWGVGTNTSVSYICEFNFGNISPQSMESGGRGGVFACWRRALSPQEISAYYRWAHLNGGNNGIR